MVGTSHLTHSPISASELHILSAQGFNGFQAATLSPLFFLSPALLGRAALYTCGVVGSLCYVGATAKNDKYLYMGGPLLAGVTVVALSSLAPLALPLGMRGLAVSEAISLYGGLAVFGGFVLYEFVPPPP
jgi:FtsH-binding integral membrane protein